MLLRNTVWSLLGEGLPLAAAVVSIPLLIAAAGMERFGALTLIWALLGYLALLDMGLVRSMVQIVSERLGRGDADPGGAPGAVAVPALALIVGLGVVAGAALALFAGPVARTLTLSDPALADEMRHALYVAAAVVPVALASSGLRGLLEAHQRFRAVNLVRMVVGVLNYLSPLAVLPFHDGLVPVLAAILAGRLLGLAALAELCRRFVDLRRPQGGGFGFAALRPLFAMGAWMTLNNLVGPAMMYADRFILGGFTAAAAVAYYTTPFEMTTRLLFIPTAVAGVLFPLVARSFRSRPENLAAVLGLGGGGLAALFALGVAAADLLGKCVLGLWLGADFARQSAVILTVLTLGTALNAVAYVPYAVLHGIGRVDVTARLQLAELPVYLAVLYWLVQAYGPLGAAAAWSMRTGADLFLLLYFVRRHAPQTGGVVVRLAAAAAVAAASGTGGLMLGGVDGTAILLIGQAAAAALGGTAALAALRSPAGRALRRTAAS